MSQPVPPETIEYEWHVDRVRRSNAKMLAALKDIILWAEPHGLTKADLVTGGQAEEPVITNAKVAIALADKLKDTPAALSSFATDSAVEQIVADFVVQELIPEWAPYTPDGARQFAKKLVGHMRPYIQQAPSANNRAIIIHVEGGMVHDVTGIPAGLEVRVEDRDDDGDTSHPLWDAEKGCFVTVYGGGEV